MPGVDPLESARVLAGELPELMPFPELPARGAGADTLGRAAALLVDLAVELVPSGYRVTARPGMDQRRAADFLRRDLDAVERAVAEADVAPGVVKVQAAGPWTLTAGVELERGHRVLTDRGALRDFTESLTEGLAVHAAEVAARTGARVMVQLDEPSLPMVLAGDVPTPSGYGSVAAIPEPEAQRLLADVIDGLAEATGSPVIVHCCAVRPPVDVLRKAGADAIALDATGLGEVSGSLAEEIGTAWQEGTTLFLGLVPTAEQGADRTQGADREPGTTRSLARPGLDLAARLGFSRRLLADSSVVTPVRGLADASPVLARKAITQARDLARLFREEAD